MEMLKQRFDGLENRQKLIEAISRQALVVGDASLAETFATNGTLEELAKGAVLVTQGEFDDDLFLILAGSFNVVVNGQIKAIRQAGLHVGEMAGVDPTQARSATLVAREPSLVMRIPQSQIAALTAENLQFWRRLSVTLGERLREQNAKIGRANDIPRVFVISSTEALPVAEQVMVCLDSKAIAVHLWDQGTFGISDYPISSLMDAIEACDFTIAIASADDVLISRDKEAKAARDNVHLEYGISLGILGRLRSMLLVQADDEVKLPSDLAGLTTLRYRHGSAEEMRRSIKKACIAARDRIEQEGVFQDRRGR